MFTCGLCRRPQGRGRKATRAVLVQDEVLNSLTGELKRFVVAETLACDECAKGLTEDVKDIVYEGSVRERLIA